MRHIGAPLVALGCVLVVGGCGSTAAHDRAAGPTSRPATGASTTATRGAPTTAPPGTTESAPAPSPSPGDTVAAYRYLVHDVTGFVAAAIAAEQQTPDVQPDDPAEVLELVDYDLADGVELAAWDDDGICFTGPGDTWWSFGEAGQTFLRLRLGTGECAGPAPDVVVDIGPGKDVSHLRTRVRAGADIAAQLPELDDFVELMNDELR